MTPVTVQNLILVVIFPLAAVLMVIEYRITRQPRAQRTARQQSILDADVRASAAYRRRTLGVYPVLVVVFAVLVLLLSIPLWLSPQNGVLGFVLAIGAVVFGVAGALGARFFLWAEGRQWVENTNSEFAEAADNSQPHWFINFKAGLAVGITFAVLGLSLMAMQLLDPTAEIGLVLPFLLFLVGVAAIVAGVAQRYADHNS